MLSEREQLRRIIQQWNENRLDLFSLSEPNEELEFHGVMRYYFQESGQRVSTKCIRVSSTATTRAVIDALIEKFHPDLKMLTLPDYTLWEVHENGEERQLQPDEKPLLVQLNWHKDDREGRFLLRNEANPKVPFPLKQIQSEEPTQMKRKLSKREKKEKKKRDKQEKASKFREAEDISEKLYSELPETSFTRTISNPEIVMKKRRERKLEQKLREMEDNPYEAGGSLKIHGDTLGDGTKPYVTLLLTVRDSAVKVVRDTLEKYGIEKHDPGNYCLVEAINPISDSNDNLVGEDVEPKERILADDEHPLAVLGKHLDGKSAITFHVRSRPSGVPKVMKQQRRPVGPPHAQLGHPQGDQVPPPLPCLVELNNDGSEKAEPRIYYLNPGLTEVGTDRQILDTGQGLVIDSRFIRPRHCIFDHTNGVVTLTPLNRECAVSVNSTPVEETVRLENGCTLRVGEVHVFRFYEPHLEHPGAKRMHPMDQHQPLMRNDGALPARRTSSNISTGKDPIPAIVELGDKSEDAFLQNVIRDLDPGNLTFQLAPVYALYMATRYRISPHYHMGLYQGERLSRLASFLQLAVDMMHVTIQDHCHDAAAMAFWLANSSELLNFMKSDGQIFTATIPEPQDSLADAVQKAYGHLAACLRQDMHQALPAMLDSSSPDPEAASPCLHMLASALQLLRHCKVNSALTIQLFSQLFHTINVYLFNWLVSREGGAYCCAAWGMRLIARVGAIQAWAEKQGLELAADVHLDKIVQAAHLLATRKTLEDLPQISAVSSKLNSEQIRCLLQRYQPAKGAPPVPQELVERVVKLAEDTADDMIRSEGNPVTLEEDTELQLPFLLPEDGYSPEIQKGIDQGLQAFADMLLVKGICRMITQNSSSGSWAVHFEEGFDPRHSTGGPPPIGDSMGTGHVAHPGTSHYQPQPRHHPGIPAPGAPHPDVQQISFDRAGGGIGLSIVAAEIPGTQDLGIYIKKVVPGSPADKDGRLSYGDQLLAVGGKSLSGISQEQAAELMAKSGPVVSFTVAKQAALYNGVDMALRQASPSVQRHPSAMNLPAHGPPPQRFRSEEQLTRQQNLPHPPGTLPAHPLHYEGGPSPAGYPVTQQHGSGIGQHHKSNPAILDPRYQHPGSLSSADGSFNDGPSSRTRPFIPANAQRVLPPADMHSQNQHSRSLSTSNLIAGGGPRVSVDGGGSLVNGQGSNQRPGHPSHLGNRGGPGGTLPRGEYNDGSLPRGPLQNNAHAPYYHPQTLDPAYQAYQQALASSSGGLPGSGDSRRLSGSTGRQSTPPSVGGGSPFGTLTSTGAVKAYQPSSSGFGGTSQQTVVAYAPHQHRGGPIEPPSYGHSYQHQQQQLLQHPVSSGVATSGYNTAPSSGLPSGASSSSTTAAAHQQNYSPIWVGGNQQQPPPNAMSPSTHVSKTYTTPGYTPIWVGPANQQHHQQRLAAGHTAQPAVGPPVDPQQRLLHQTQQQRLPSQSTGRTSPTPSTTHAPHVRHALAPDGNPGNAPMVVRAPSYLTTPGSNPAPLINGSAHFPSPCTSSNSTLTNNTNGLSNGVGGVTPTLGNVSNEHILTTPSPPLGNTLIHYPASIASSSLNGASPAMTPTSPGPPSASLLPYGARMVSESPRQQQHSPGGSMIQQHPTSSSSPNVFRFSPSMSSPAGFNNPTGAAYNGDDSRANYQNVPPSPRHGYNGNPGGQFGHLTAGMNGSVLSAPQRPYSSVDYIASYSNNSAAQWKNTYNRASLVHGSNPGEHTNSYRQQQPFPYLSAMNLTNQHNSLQPGSSVGQHVSQRSADWASSDPRSLENRHNQWRHANSNVNVDSAACVSSGVFAGYGNSCNIPVTVGDHDSPSSSGSVTNPPPDLARMIGAGSDPHHFVLLRQQRELAAESAQMAQAQAWRAQNPEEHDMGGFENGQPGAIGKAVRAQRMSRENAEKVQVMLDEEIERLETMPERTEIEEERLRGLKLEREFQRRLREAELAEDGDGEEDENDLSESSAARQQLARVMHEEMTARRVDRSVEHQQTKVDREEEYMAREAHQRALMEQEKQKRDELRAHYYDKAEQTYLENAERERVKKTQAQAEQDRISEAAARAEEARLAHQLAEQEARRDREFREMQNIQSHIQHLMVDGGAQESGHNEENGDAQVGRRVQFDEDPSTVYYDRASSYAGSRSPTSPLPNGHHLPPVSSTDLSSPPGQVLPPMTAPAYSAAPVRSPPNDYSPSSSIAGGVSINPPAVPSKPRYNYNTEPMKGNSAVIGNQEVYRDPRELRLKAKQQPSKDSDGEKLSFSEKMKLFAREAGEGTPKDRMKASSAQREIEGSLLER